MQAWTECEGGAGWWQWEMQGGLLIGCGKGENLVHRCGKVGWGGRGSDSWNLAYELRSAPPTLSHKTRKDRAPLCRVTAGNVMQVDGSPAA